MGDVSRRLRERGHRTHPHDQESLRHAIAARRRAGLSAADLLEQVIHPARRFNTGLHCQVWAQLPGGEWRDVGRAPTYDGEGVQIPPHRAWKVVAEGFPTAAEVAAQLMGRDVRGLALREAISDRGLAQLCRIESLTHLDLGDCHQVTDGGLALMAERLPDLIELKLGRCERLSDEGLRHLGRLRDLRGLRLAGAERITDAGVAQLAGLSNLSGLNLSGAKQLTNHSLEALAACEELATLNLRECNRLTSLEPLAGLERLRSMNLAWCQRLPDRSLQGLGALPGLKSVELYGCDRIADPTLARLAELPQLHTLIVGPSLRGISDRGLAALTESPTLSRLSLTWCGQVTDEGLGHLSRVETLRELDLLGCTAISDDGLAHLSRLPHLSRLNLWQCAGITDAGLAQLDRPALKLSLKRELQDVIRPSAS